MLPQAEASRIEDKAARRGVPREEWNHHVGNLVILLLLPLRMLSERQLIGFQFVLQNR